MRSSVIALVLVLAAPLALAVSPDGLPVYAGPWRGADHCDPWATDPFAPLLVQVGDGAAGSLTVYLEFYPSDRFQPYLHEESNGQDGLQHGGWSEIVVDDYGPCWDDSEMGPDRLWY